MEQKSSKPLTLKSSVGRRDGCAERKEMCGTDWAVRKQIFYKILDVFREGMCKKQL